MKTEFRDIKQQRVYIKNFINRRFTGERKCVVCGNTENLTVVHNELNPYNISFICRNCRAKLNKSELSNLPKINILENIEVNKKFSHSKNLVLDGRMKFILEQALETELSLIEYLKTQKISYHKYKVAIKLYEKEVAPIENQLRIHFNQLRAKNIRNSIENHKTKTSE